MFHFRSTQSVFALDHAQCTETMLDTMFAFEPELEAPMGVKRQGSAWTTTGAKAAMNTMMVGIAKIVETELDVVTSDPLTMTVGKSAIEWMQLSCLFLFGFPLEDGKPVYSYFPVIEY